MVIGLISAVISPTTVRERGSNANQIRTESPKVIPTVSPSPRKDRESSSNETLPDENIVYSAINRYLRDNLNDPSSLEDLEIRGIARVKNSSSYRVVAFYRAKNGFGALVTQQQAFILSNAPEESRNTLFFHVRPE